jgi:hypothetical protein
MPEMTCCALPKNVPIHGNTSKHATAHRNKLQSINKMKQKKGLFNQKKNQLQELDFTTASIFES